MKKLYALLIISLISGILFHNANAADEGSAHAEVLTSVINISVVTNPNMGRFYVTNPSNDALLILNPDETVQATNINHRGGQNKGQITIQAAASTGILIGYDVVQDVINGYPLTNVASGDTIKFHPAYSLNTDSNLFQNLDATTNALGNITVYIGGTLKINEGTNPAPGAYTGSFNISVRYQ